MYKYAEQLYTSFTDGLCLCVHNCTLLYNLTLSKHTLVVHTLCSDQLYCCTFILYSGTVLLCLQLHCTTVHSLLQAWPLFCQPITEDLRFTCFTLIGPLGIPFHHQLNHSMLTTSFPKGNGRGKNILAS